MKDNLETNSEDVSSCMLNICFISDNVENSEYPGVANTERKILKTSTWIIWIVIDYLEE